MRTTRSLAFWVALWTAIVIGASMAVYAVFQYLLMPGVTAAELLVRHLWHVVVLGALTYAFCWFGLRLVVVDPLRELFVHLYRVGSGELRPIKIETHISEVRDVVDGINTMIWRLTKHMDRHAVIKVERNIGHLRKMISSLPESKDPEKTAEALERVSGLEKDLLTAIGALQRLNAARKGRTEETATR